MANSNPYTDKATNFIYNLLFCDDPGLFKEKVEQPYAYPYDIVFSDTPSISALQKIIDDADADPRVKLLAYRKQSAMGHPPSKKEILGVIVEVGLEEGLDVLASFKNGTARYINQSGSMLVWENTSDPQVNLLTRDLFDESEEIIKQIGPWDKPRRPFPSTGNLRISFLVSDGLYFGEGPMNVLFNDELASVALGIATELMQYLTEKTLDQNNQAQ